MLKNATEEKRLEEVRKLYEASFPEAEKKPFALMLKKREEGFFDILSIEDESGAFCGLAIMMLSGGLALLDYLAVVPGHQGSGVGSNTLRELRERYGEDKIVVEIESTVGEAAETAENRKERLRRKDFYLRNGMTPMNFLAEVMGVEMEILTFGRKVAFSEYYAIYAGVLGQYLSDKIKKAGAAV